MSHKKEAPINPPDTGVKRDEKGRFIKGFANANPNGAPKRGQSWQETIKRITDMTKGELIQHVGGKSTKLGKILEELPDNIPVKDAMVLIGIIQFGRDPEARMLTALMDREEGKPRQPVGLDGVVTFENIQKALDKAYGTDNPAE